MPIDSLTEKRTQIGQLVTDLLKYKDTFAGTLKINMTNLHAR